MIPCNQSKARKCPTNVEVKLKTSAESAMLTAAVLMIAFWRKNVRTLGKINEAYKKTGKLSALL